jgi:hypothetical protein
VKSGNPATYVSTAVVALVMAALLNVWLVTAHPLAKVPTANLDSGEVAHALTALDRDPDFSGTPRRAPRICLLGSSLVLAPALQAEANYLHVPIQRLNDRRSHYLEAQFNDSASKPNIFCLAIGGSMISDAYLLVKHVLTGNRQPDAIVFGVAPRDFQDNLCPAVQATETFKKLASPADVLDVFATQKPSFESGFDLLMSEFVPLWKYHTDIRTFALLRTKKTMEACMPWVVFDKYGETLELKPRRHGVYPEETHGTPMVLPHVAMNHTSVDATRDEYRQRYNPLNPQFIEQEFGYLNKLLSLCHQRNIRILVVNMPLSKDNLALLPSGFYQDYLQRLAQTCSQHQAELVNMCNADTTRNELFADGVHLDTDRSEEFWKAVQDKFNKSAVATVLNRTN